MPTTPPPSHRGRLVRALGTISFYTLLSRVLGFVRDIVIARGFGAGMGADAFFVALKLPNFLRRLFAEGAFNTAFVPVFSDYVTGDDPAATRRMVQAVFTRLLLVLTILLAVAQLLMPWLIMVVAPGFIGQPDKFQLTVDLTRITFPYILFISLVAMAGGVLNSFHRFAVPAATPILLNVCLIGGALWLAPLFDEPAMGLAWGVFLGGVAQLAIQLPALKGVGMPLRWRWEPGHPAIHRILILMGPSVLGVSVAQINLVFDIFLASFLPQGSISYLYYADRLVEFPLGLFGIAMATAILPALSAKASTGDTEGLKGDLSFAMRVVWAINIPAMVGLVVLREPILSLLFQRGAFDAEATRLSGQALLAYGLGLLAFSAVKVIAPAFYAMKDTRTPVRIAMTCFVANMVLNVILMFPLKHAGLALATTLAAYLNMALLLRAMKGRLGFHLGGGFLVTALKSGAASGVMGLALWWGLERFYQADQGTVDKALVLLPLIGAGVVVYAVAAWAFRLSEVHDLLRVMRRRAARRRPSSA